MKNIFYYPIISLLLFSVSTVFADQMQGDYMLQSEEGIALKGYDVISFFDGNPSIGNPVHQMEFAEVTWYFSDLTNLERFKKDPKRYLPEYHGYCVWALADDRLQPGVIDHWHVYGNKLYFLCSEDAKNKWLKDPDKYNRAAIRYWFDLKRQGENP